MPDPFAGGVHRRQRPKLVAWCDATEGAIRRAFAAPANRETLAEFARHLAAPNERPGDRRQHGPVRLEDGDVTLKAQGRIVVKPTIRPSRRVSVSNMIVSVRDLVAPDALRHALPGRPIGDIVETGMPEVDAATVRIARQNGTVLCLHMDAQPRVAAMVDMFALAGLPWPPID